MYASTDKTVTTVSKSGKIKTNATPLRGEKDQMTYLQKRRIPLLLLCVITILTVMMALTAFAQESEQKVVRMGWYESPFNLAITSLVK